MDEDSGSTFAPHSGTLGDLGVRAIRVPFFWHFEQDRLNADQVAELTQITATTPRNVRIVLQPMGHVTPLEDAARGRYCAFVGDAVTRFPAIRDVIIWNEPNKSDYWRPQYDAAEKSAAPAAYVELLARCWDHLHAVRADVNVVAPATSPRGNDQPNAVSNISHSPLTFIRRMGEAYRASGRTRRLFDTVAHHAYGSQPGERPWRTHAGNQISQGDHQRLLNQLAYAFKGTGQAVPGECKPGGCVWIWYAEAGYQTIPDEAKAHLYTGTENFTAIPDFVGGEPDSPAPSAASTAPDAWTQIHDGIRLARCQAYVQGFFNYLLIDQPELGRWQSGLFWADGTPKRSYEAFKRVAAEASSDRTDCSTLKGGAPPRPDTLPPGQVTGLTGRPGAGRVTLAWAEAAANDVMGYHVYRSDSRGGPYARVTSRPVDAASYVDGSVTDRRTYWYAVSALDTGENEGGRSAAVCVTPRRNTERYAVTELRRGRGAMGRARAVTRLHRDDAVRIVITAAPGRQRVASLVAKLRLPPCLRAPRTLKLDVQAAASATGFPIDVAVLTRGGTWGRVAAGPSARADRLLSRTTKSPARWIRGGEVTVRVRVTSRAPFRASVDLLRLVARY